MIKILLGHQWKSFWRSRDAGKSLAFQIFIGFITLYFLVCAVFLGFFLQHLLTSQFPGQNSIFLFCGFLLYYFLFDTLARFMLQNLPTLSIQPYLVQNIRRSQLIRFLNIRSLITVFNVLPVLLFLPFTVVAIGPAHGFVAATAFITSLLALTVFNHFLVLYIKRKSIINSWWMVIFFIVIGRFIAVDYFNIFSLSHLSAKIFSGMVQHAWSCILVIALAALSFTNNYYFLLKNLYLEDIVSSSRKKQGAAYSFLNRFGTVGELVALDLKLIIRNKRPRSVIMMSVLFLFYGLIFYKQKYINENWWGFLLFGGISLTGIFVGNYGQFLFAWQSVHFDGLMAGKLNVRNYIESKFLLFTGVCTIILLVTSLYGFWSWKLLVVQVAGYLYNVGVQTVMTVYMATYSYKAIDISRKATFNFQGMGAEKWMYSLLAFSIPMIVYWPFALLINSAAGLAAIGLLGLISFLLRDWWITLLTKEFFKRKHRILEGFRGK